MCQSEWRKLKLNAAALARRLQDNCGYVMEGKSYVLNEKGERVELGAGDKLILPAGAVHAEGEVTERMVYIVGISKPENLFDALLRTGIMVGSSARPG